MTAQDYVDQLRKLADWIEENEEELGDTPNYTSSLGTLLLYAGDKERMAELVKLLGGHRGKSADDKFFNVVRSFGPINVEVFASRSEVCRRVVTGTRTVTETVLDPEALEACPMVEVTREEEIVKWECDPILGELAEVTS